jgi:hypothetical protein
MTGRKPTKGDAARKTRLRAALRENLKRRKAQARGRAALAEGKDTSAKHTVATGEGPKG